MSTLEFENKVTITETIPKHPPKPSIPEPEISSETSNLALAMQKSVAEDEPENKPLTKLNHCQNHSEIKRFFEENNITPGQTIIIGLRGHGQNRAMIGGEVTYLRHTSTTITIKYADSYEETEFPFSAMVIQLPKKTDQTS